jgi:hypothetical protein
MASEDEEEEEEESEYDKDESWLIFPIVYFSKTCEFEQNNIEIQNILNKIL